jgi:hypothetical protein
MLLGVVLLLSCWSFHRAQVLVAVVAAGMAQVCKSCDAWQRSCLDPLRNDGEDADILCHRAL